jgi:hypothetical protein
MDISESEEQQEKYEKSCTYSLQQQAVEHNVVQWFQFELLSFLWSFFGHGC